MADPGVIQSVSQAAHTVQADSYGESAGEKRLPQGCRWIQPSEDVSAMAAPGAEIMRVHVDEIKSFRKEFWKQELPVVVTGASLSNVPKLYGHIHLAVRKQMRCQFPACMPSTSACTERWIHNTTYHGLRGFRPVNNSRPSDERLPSLWLVLCDDDEPPLRGRLGHRLRSCLLLMQEQ